MASLTCRVQFLNDIDPFSASTNFPEPPRPPFYTFNVNLPLINQIAGVHRLLRAPHKLDDCTLQVYKSRGPEGDYGSYLDLESTLDEQAEELDGFQDNKKNAILLRTQLSVRVHAIIERLVNSSGRELRRALFALKQIFQDDKDLVHEFVQNDGLTCLIKVGSEADQNYQNYILRALGQVMLYVDGMNGVMEHSETIQWLYSLISSKFRLVVKTALKLLLVFVEYTETNSLLLLNAISTVDRDKGAKSWSNIMNLLNEKDSSDTELLVFAVTLINKTLDGIPDQDTFYDVVDALEEQNMEHVIQYYMSRQGTDLELIHQFNIYELVLKREDGDSDPDQPLLANYKIRQSQRRSHPSFPHDSRRKSRRHSTESRPNPLRSRNTNLSADERPGSRKSEPLHYNNNNINVHQEKQINGNIEQVNGITPGLRRRRERDAHNRTLIKEQEANGREVIYHKDNSKTLPNNHKMTSPEHHPDTRNECKIPSLVQRQRTQFENLEAENNRKNKEKCLPHQPTPPRTDSSKKTWMLSMMYGKSQDEDMSKTDGTTKGKEEEVVVVRPQQIRKEPSATSLQDRWQNRPEAQNHHMPNHNAYITANHAGLISRAKEGLVASVASSRANESRITQSSSHMMDSPSAKRPDSELQWDHLSKTINRPLVINGLNFTDLTPEDDLDFLGMGPPAVNGCSGDVGEGIPPPPPPLIPPPPPPFCPPPPIGLNPPPPPPLPSFLNPPPHLKGPPPPSQQPSWAMRNGGSSVHARMVNGNNAAPVKTKKTVKLFWREVKEDAGLLSRIGRRKTIWDELKPVELDLQKLEHLFENRAKEIISKEKGPETGGKKHEIIVLDTKRSNAINIGMTKLPPARTIKTAILKMDSTIMNREGIEKILTTMLPTEEEKTKITEAQMANPDVPLGSAEQLLLTLASISELEARLRLWAFRLDYETMEREVAEPLMDLKQAIVEIESNQTFRVILATLRSIGNFLNSAQVKGFQIDYLSKVPEVKDTVHKHSLLYHLCQMVMEKFHDSTDLYSEFGAVTRASKVDYDEVAKNLAKMESDCKASWEYLKAIAKHDGSTSMRVKMSEFLADCAERIVVLGVIHRRVSNRFNKFLVYLGVGQQKHHVVCKVLSEFALEYRTTRERVLQQVEKKANHRERNKTRGKMIIEMDKFKNKEQQQADQELRQILANGTEGGGRYQKWGTVPAVRGSRQKPSIIHNTNTTPANMRSTQQHDDEDEMLESLVRTAQSTRSSEPRYRKKARYGDRKS